MKPPTFSVDLQECLSEWLDHTLGFAGAEETIPEGDPLRIWWSPEPRATAMSRLVALLCGGNDHLTLLALVQRARVAGPPPRKLEERLNLELHAVALSARSTTHSAPHEMDTFLSYAHEDMERAATLARLLRSHGLRLYRDLEQIQPGESITARLGEMLSAVDSAVVIVSRFSLKSEWVERELKHLLERRADSDLLVLPILVDDVPLPEAITDLFTIDLRGYGGEQDDAWAYPRLQPLIQRALAASKRESR